MPRSEAYLDAPRSLRRVAYRGSFTDSLAGVAFVAGVAQSGMPSSVLARLIGVGLPLDDLGPWEDAPPAVESPDAVLPSEPAPVDPPVASVPSPMRPVAPFSSPRRR